VIDYVLVAPEAVMLLTALAAVLAGLGDDDRAVAGAWVGVAGCTSAAVFALVAGRGTLALPGFDLAVDGAAQYTRVAICALAAVWCLWLAGAGSAAKRSRLAPALVALSCAGSIVLTVARDWVVLFLALEAAAVPVYVLLGSDRTDRRGLGDVVRYLAVSVAGSLVVLYGISFVLGTSGSTTLAASKIDDGPLGWVAAALVLAGLAMKLGAAPLHVRMPAAYGGAPAWAAAFAASVPKIAVTVAFARVLEAFAGRLQEQGLVLGAAAVLSMTLGSIGALREDDVRRMMAHSGAVHAGFVLVALAAGGPGGLRSAVVYSAVFALPTMAVLLVSAEEGAGTDDLGGLWQRRRGAAGVLAVSLVSLVGVAPLAGFFGKLYVFGAALRAGMWWTVTAGVVLSILSALYYGRLVRSAFSGHPSGPPLTPEDRAPAASVALAVCVVAPVAFGAVAPLLSALGVPLT
jgi:NADH-quinone oxidoreductase subunit N